MRRSGILGLIWIRDIFDVLALKHYSAFANLSVLLGETVHRAHDISTVISGPSHGAVWGLKHGISPYEEGGAAILQLDEAWGLIEALSRRSCRCYGAGNRGLIAPTLG